MKKREIKAMDARHIEWSYQFWLFGFAVVYPAWKDETMTTVALSNAIGFASRKA
jgi:hypothetical protein